MWGGGEKGRGGDSLACEERKPFQCVDVVRGEALFRLPGYQSSRGSTGGPWPKASVVATSTAL